MSIKSIKKRDGRVVSFDQSKISTAILKAFGAAYQPDMAETAKRLATQVASMLEVEGTEIPEVEHVQDLVELVLMEEDYPQTAKAYILYRGERARARALGERLKKIYEDITWSPAKTSGRKREISGADGGTAMGSLFKYGSESAKAYFQTYVLKPEFAAAHAAGDIHIHDLDFYTYTSVCTQIDLLKLFHGGFSGGLCRMREPNGIASYAALACVALQSNQNDQHGEQSIVNFDYAMAEGVGKTFTKLYRQNLARALELEMGDGEADDAVQSLSAKIVKESHLTPSLQGGDAYLALEQAALMKRYGVSRERASQLQSFAHRRGLAETDRATYQAMEALLHNLNAVESRAGARAPLSALNYGLDTSPEGRMAVKNLLLATQAGLGGGETAVFPAQIFRVKDGVNLNPGEPNYDLFQLACRCSATRLFPNFVFQDAPFNLPSYRPGRPETEISAMGCRVRVTSNIHDPNRESAYRRGCLSATSVNLPRLAIEAKGDLRAFYAGLDRMLDLCAGQLAERFEIQGRRLARNFPFLMSQGVWLDSDLLKPDDEVSEVLKHGTLSIGFIGLAEALTALVGQHHGACGESQALGLEIVGHMRARTDAESERRGLNFTLLASPAESLSGRFAELDQERYGILPGVTDRAYYTDSFHIPVYFPISAWEKIRLEAPYHALTNGGHISYVELDGDISRDMETFERLIRRMKDSGIGYGAVNHSTDRDPVCGYTGYIGAVCPGCGRKVEDGPAFERIRRVAGYPLRTPDRLGDAERAELSDRVRHRLGAED